MYEIVADGIIKRLSDGAFITIGSETGDYADFVRWVAEGNTPSQPESDFQFLKQEKLSALAAKRFAVENGGVTIPGIGRVSTGEKTRATIDQTLSSMDRGFITTVSWKLSQGVFVDLDKDGLLTIARAVAEFVDQCFKRERILSGQIMAATNQSELDAVDIESGWPS